MYFTALLIFNPAVYSGKYFSSGIWKQRSEWYKFSQSNGETTNFGQLVPEYVNLVKEKNDGCS
jgi:hypothetical protein